jgi:hypothetical protein
VDAGGESDVGVLALAEGVRIAGKIATEPPLRQMGNPTVSVVSIEPPKVYVGVGGQFLSFENGSVRRYMAVTSVAADGTFAVGGLPPGRYVLHDNATGVSKAMSQALLQPFDAPTDRADFIYRGVIVSVLVRRGGAPAKGASLSVTGGGGDRVGDDGIARFLAEPGASYEVEARLKGCPSVQATVIAPAAAVAGGTPTATIDLPEPAAVPPPATWTLTIQPDGAASPTAAGIGFFAVKAGKPALFPAFTRDATGDGGVFTVTDIPPGHWRIEIRAGAAWADPSGFLVTAPVERELASGETAADVVRATPGGRLVVSVQEADESRATGVICKLTDAAHAQVPVWLGTHRFVNGYSSQSSSTALSDFAPSDVFPALPPGRYTLEFTRYGASGPVTVTVPADVVAGKVTEVSAKLPPR